MASILRGERGNVRGEVHPVRDSPHEEELVPHLDRTATVADALTELVYELLDAHADTVRLVHEQPSELGWGPHVAYLRDLQRVSRETLARLPAP